MSGFLCGRNHPPSPLRARIQAGKRLSLGPRPADDGRTRQPTWPMANDQDTPLPSTPSESAASAPAYPPKKLEQPAMWPGNVPTQAQALEVLRGKLLLARSLPSARRV